MPLPHKGRVLPPVSPLKGGGTLASRVQETKFACDD